MTGIDLHPREAWAARAVDARATSVRPRIGEGRLAPITISGHPIRRSTSSGVISGTAEPRSGIIVASDGALFRTTADASGAWSVLTEAGEGEHEILASQVTLRGIHRPAIAALTVTGPWVLATGFWNDDGVWDDAAVWID